MPNFEAGIKAVLWGDGHDVSIFASNLGQTNTADTYDATTFRKSSKVYQGGQTDAQLSVDGIFSGSITDYLTPEVISMLAGKNVVYHYFPQGCIAGARGIGFYGFANKFDITSPDSDLTRFTQAAQGSNGSDVIRALLTEATQIAGSSQGAAVDDGIGASANGIIYAAVGGLESDLAGGTYTLTVQHSPDATTWADLQVFNFGGTARSARVLVSAVARYTRLKWVTSTPANLIVGFGRK